jgi:hypothetical protein
MLHNRHIWHRAADLYTFSRLVIVELGTEKVSWVHVELEGREGGKEHILV